MNAYELAKQLDQLTDLFQTQLSHFEYSVVINSINMLRQQASELDKVIPQLVKANVIIENLRIRIAELEKELKRHEKVLDMVGNVLEKQSEPVAELLVNDGEPWGCRYDDNITFAGVDGWIPLYTTPQTKPLSDEANIEDYKVALDDVKRLTRELDVALNGDGAAQQASLCDIVCQVKSSKWKLVQTKPLSDEEIAELENALDVCDYKYFGSYEFSENQWKAFEILEKYAKEKLKQAIEAKVRGEK